MTPAVKEEVLSLLKWSMLAACTIGPGTVIVCSQGGSEFKLRLLWTLVIASVAAYVLQKEAARLTIASGMSFGQAIRLHFRKGGAALGSDGAMPFMGYVVVIFVYMYVQTPLPQTFGLLHRATAPLLHTYYQPRTAQS